MENKLFHSWWTCQIGLNGAAVSGWKKEALESMKVDFNLDRVRAVTKARAAQKGLRISTAMQGERQAFMARLGL